MAKSFHVFFQKKSTFSAFGVIQDTKMNLQDRTHENITLSFFSGEPKFYELSGLLIDIPDSLDAIIAGCIYILYIIRCKVSVGKGRGRMIG
jgi:hypothetical protein